MELKVLIGRYVIYGGSHGKAFGQCSPSFLLLPLRMSIIWQARHKRVSRFLFSSWDIGNQLYFPNILSSKAYLRCLSVCVSYILKSPSWPTKFKTEEYWIGFGKAKCQQAPIKYRVFQLHSSKLATKVTKKVFFELKFRQVCYVKLQ